ncbi:hypothetical protein HNR74_003889 [Flammeovirga kamogawensis]|nr:hypothetical protein [Flammeovirga kamogawensis]
MFNKLLFTTNDNNATYKYCLMIEWQAPTLDRGDLLRKKIFKRKCDFTIQLVRKK